MDMGTSESREFGTYQGQTVMLYTLTNGQGAQMQVTNYGGIITRLTMPDRKGNFDDIVLGYENLQDYIDDSPYFGAIIGRYGNRIANGRFKLDSQEYTLAQNNNGNHLHGGDFGFDKRVWDARTFDTDQGPAIEFHRVSPDGEEGYSGNLDVTITYILTNDNELVVTYHATTDKPTVCNLTQHSYFNLAGHDAGSITDHVLMINADYFTPVDEGLIPTGEIRPVKATPFDFTTPRAIGTGIDADNQQIEYGLGYDHNWVLNKDYHSEMTLAGTVFEPRTGRYMEVWTEEPGVQFYAGNFLDGSNVGKGGAVYDSRTGFCLETQHFPDSPNHGHFPSTVLSPGQVYQTRTVYRFSAR